MWSTLRVGSAKDRNKANGLRLLAVLLMAGSSSMPLPRRAEILPQAQARRKLDRHKRLSVTPVPADLKPRLARPRGLTALRVVVQPFVKPTGI